MVDRDELKSKATEKSFSVKMLFRFDLTGDDWGAATGKSDELLEAFESCRGLSEVLAVLSVDSAEGEL